MKYIFKNYSLRLSDTEWSPLHIFHIILCYPCSNTYCFYYSCKDIAIYLNKKINDNKVIETRMGINLYRSL